MTTSTASRGLVFGANSHGDQTEFRLWAPNAKSVVVRVLGRGDFPLSRDDNGVFTGTLPARSGDRYSYLIDGGNPLPDPVSRLLPEGVHGPTEIVDHEAFHWTDHTWRGLDFRDYVIYELHIGTFTREGTFDSAIEKLSYLRQLGVTAIEIMPVAAFPGTRNWGYDGVLPYAPDSAHGPRDGLKRLVDEAHGLGLMVFLDVVYNHFGPDGNWLPAYCPSFFDPTVQTPWGAAIDFSELRVRAFFGENVLYWLEVFRLDGLRFDAVHAIGDRTWLADTARMVRDRLPSRHIHLVLENEANDAGLLRGGFDAQWSDDFHNVMHVLLTGETHAYYEDFADRPAQRLARALSEGFVYQGEASPHHGGAPRGQPSADLPPTAFVSFLQNHDQVGNRALGGRLTQLARPAALRAAMALMLLCPQIPMLFMGEEVGAREPFLFFTDFHGELAAAVREGRRREFAHSPGFGADADLAAIPDPNAEATFKASRWTEAAPDAADWRTLVSHLLTLRHEQIVPHLDGAAAIGAEAIGDAAVIASWRLGDGATLTIAVNLGETPVEAVLPTTEPLFGAPSDGVIPPDTTVVWITP